MTPRPYNHHLDGPASQQRCSACNNPDPKPEQPNHQRKSGWSSDEPDTQRKGERRLAAVQSGKGRLTASLELVLLSFVIRLANVGLLGQGLLCFLGGVIFRHRGKQKHLQFKLGRKLLRPLTVKGGRIVSNQDARGWILNRASGRSMVSRESLKCLAPDRSSTWNGILEWGTFGIRT